MHYVIVLYHRGTHGFMLTEHVRGELSCFCRILLLHWPSFSYNIQIDVFGKMCLVSQDSIKFMTCFRNPIVFFKLNLSYPDKN